MLAQHAHAIINSIVLRSPGRALRQLARRGGLSALTALTLSHLGT